MKKPKNKLIRPLLYIDLLGFSNDILKLEIEESIDYYEDFLRALTDMASVHKKLKFTFVSDSAFLWIDDSNIEHCIEAVFAVAFSLFHNSFFSEIHSLRGAIVYDEFEISHREFKIGKSKISSPIIIGKGIINAYRWEQIQNWLGISIHPNDITKFEDKHPKLFSRLVTENAINLYDIPTKFGPIQSYAIGLHSSHLEGKLIYESTKKKKMPTFEKIMSVNTYDSLLLIKRGYTSELGAISKITATFKYLRHLKNNKLGKDEDWSKQFKF